MSYLVVEDLLLIGGSEKALSKCLGRFNRESHFQGAAANLSGAHVWTAEFPGAIGDVTVTGGAACAAGESMTFDVLKNGVSILTAVATLDSSSGNVVTASIDKDKRTFVKGDIFTTTRVYTAGGGPTPLKDTRVIIEPSNRPWK